MASDRDEHGGGSLPPPPGGSNGPGTPGWGRGANWGDPQSTEPDYGSPKRDPYGNVRAMTVADVLDGMFRLIKDHWRTFLLAVGGVLVPLSLLSNILLAAIAPDLIVPDFQAMFDPEQIASGEALFGAEVFVALGAVSALGFFITTPVTWAVCTRVAGEAIAGRAVSPGDSVRQGLRRYPSVLAIFLLQALAFVLLIAVVAMVTFLAVQVVGDLGALILLPLLLGLVVVVAWLYTRWSLAVPVAVIENAKPVRSLRRSWRLTSRRFWWLFGTLLLVQIIATVVGSIASTPFQLGSLAAQSAAFLAAIIVSLGAVVSGLITTPVTVNALALLYTDRRVRAEGADLLAGHEGEWRSSGPPGSEPTANW